MKHDMGEEHGVGFMSIGPDDLLTAAVRACGASTSIGVMIDIFKDHNSSMPADVRDFPAGNRVYERVEEVIVLLEKAKNLLLDAQGDAKEIMDKFKPQFDVARELDKAFNAEVPFTD